MKMKICSAPGCSKLIPNDGPSRCEEHKNTPFESAIRSNQGWYQSIEWRRLRKKILERDGAICSVCKREGYHIDHIKAPRGDVGLFLDECNLQVLCSFHHRLKTAEEIRERKANRP